MQTHALRRTIGVLIALSVLAGLFGCNRNISDKKIDFIDLNRAVELYESGLEDPENVLFIDARNPERFAAGHISGARNIRVNEIDPDYEPDPELIKYKNLVVYGENPASATARVMAKRLVSAGYNTIMRTRVRLFAGGWIVWDESGLPVDIDPQEETDTETGTEDSEGATP